MTGSPAQLSWAPSAETSRRILFYVAILLVAIGAIAFGLSFDSVMIAARPVFGAASWAVPVLMDTTLAALTAAGLVLELNGLRARLPQWFARVLIGLTVFANVEPAHGLFARVLHGAPPTVWAALVVIAEQTVRRLANLTAENRLEGIRRSLWVLRPAATWRLWRRMRIQQLATYREALDQDGARAAVVGRLRLHYGRLWRWNAPLAERIALRLEGRDPDGIAAILTAHQTTTALLAGTYLDPAVESAPEAIEQARPEPEPETRPEPIPDPPEPAAEKPARKRPSARGRKPSKTPRPRRPFVALLEDAKRLNAEAIAQTDTPVSLRQIVKRLHVGQQTAERLRLALTVDANPLLPSRVVDVVDALTDAPAEHTSNHANGAAVDYDAIVARL